MKKIFKKVWPFALTAVLLFLLFSHVEVGSDPIGGVVQSHATIGKYEIYYHTVIVRDDGEVVDESGLGYYVLPVGTRVTLQKDYIRWR